MDPKKGSFAPFRHKAFRRYLGIRFLLTVAAQLQTTILGFYVYQLTHSKIAIAFVGLSEVIPAIGIALYGGYVTDKTEKRGLLLKVGVGIWVIALAMLVVTLPHLLNPQMTVLMLYGLLFGNGTARAFYEPALFAVYTQSIPKKDYPIGNNWNNLSWQAASILGPLAAGFLYAYGGGITMTFAVIGVLNLLVVLLITTLGLYPAINGSSKTPAQNQLPAQNQSPTQNQLPAQNQPPTQTQLPAQNQPPGKNIAAGLHFVFANKLMLYAMSLDLFSVFFGGVSALLPVYALDLLKVGAQGLGVMRMAISAGATLTMLVAVRFPPMGKPWRNLLIAVGGFGCCIIGFGLSGTFVLSVCFLFGQGAFDSISVLIRSTIMQLLTPEHMRGRVASVNNMFIASTAEIGDFESGMMASMLGTVPAVLVGGCITLGVVGFTLIRTKRLLGSSLDQLTTGDPAPAVPASNVNAPAAPASTVPAPEDLTASV